MADDFWNVGSGYLDRRLPRYAGRDADLIDIACSARLRCRRLQLRMDVEEDATAIFCGVVSCRPKLAPAIRGGRRSVTGITILEFGAGRRTPSMAHWLVWVRVREAVEHRSRERGVSRKSVAVVRASPRRGGARLRRVHRAPRYSPSALERHEARPGDYAITTRNHSPRR